MYSHAVFTDTSLYFRIQPEILQPGEQEASDAATASAPPEHAQQKYGANTHMNSKTVMGIAALALGIACATAPAVAKDRKTIFIHPATSYSNTGPWSAPLSPGGIAAAGDAFGGPGFNGPYGQTYRATPATYSNSGPWSAPLSPGGIAAAGDAFGGPGFNGPYGATARTGSGLYAYASTVKYSNTGPSGAPLSPGGIGAAADAFGGPGYLQ
jgi:hypothetical protein